jgi:hypothetical protein
MRITDFSSPAFCIPPSKSAIGATAVDPRRGTIGVGWLGEGRSSSWSDLYHFLRLLAVWSCGRRASVVQAQRQIHRAHLGRPGRRRRLVAQGLVRPAVVIQGDEITPIRLKSARSFIGGIRGSGVLFMSVR